VGSAALAFLLRLFGDRSVAPFDDLYHLKRIRFSAEHFPLVLEFDPDRGVNGAFVPWPPLYDLLAGVVVRLLGEGAVIWIPPVVTALLVGVTVWVVGRPLLIIPLACAPFLVVTSSPGDIDHHFLEPFLVLAITGGTVLVMRGRSGIHLTMAISAAMFVQTALIIAVGLSFLALLWFKSRNDVAPASAGVPFAVASIVIAVYRLTRPDDYPDSPWFLGWPHAALLAAAAIALTPRSKLLGLLAGAVFIAAMPGMLASLASGSTFFGADPWLATIDEFQPAWRPLPRLMNTIGGLLAGGIAAIFLLRRRPEHATIGIFTLMYVALTIPTRRFSTISTVLALVAGALLVDVLWREGRRKFAMVLAAAIVIVPPAQLAAWSGARATSPASPANHPAAFRVAEFLRREPTPGRVLGPWSYGHLFDVVGERPVILDNFGTMATPDLFWRAQSVLASRNDELLAAFCDETGVRFVVLQREDWRPRGFVPLYRDETFVVLGRR
jgi:asparagine N-glycosylation enzyme membrane subunit Stt3